MRRLVKELGLTAIHVTHDQEEAMSISDRIVLMRSGEVAEVLPPDEMYYESSYLFSQNFVGESNFLLGRITERNRQLVVEIEGGEAFKFQKQNFRAEDPVVLVVRPERLRLRHEKKGTHVEIPCVIKDIVFMGSYYSYTVQIESGTELYVNVFATAQKRFNRGQSAFVVLNPKKCRLFHHPKEGLEEALRLE